MPGEEQLAVDAALGLLSAAQMWCCLEQPRLIVALLLSLIKSYCLYMKLPHVYRFQHMLAL